MEESNELHFLATTIFHNVTSLTPSVRQIVQNAKNYQKSLQVTCNLAVVFYDSLQSLANATFVAEGAMKSIGDVILDIMDAYKEVENMKLELIKLFINELIIPMESTAEDEINGVKLAQKTFFMENKSQNDVTEKARAKHARAHKKCQSKRSKKPTKYEQQERQACDALLEEEKRLMDVRENGLRTALIEERKLYCFFAERMCSYGRGVIVYNNRISDFVTQKLPDWQQAVSNPTLLPPESERIIENPTGYKIGTVRRKQSKEAGGVVRKTSVKRANTFNTHYSTRYSNGDEHRGAKCGATSPDVKSLASNTSTIDSRQSTIDSRKHKRNKRPPLPALMRPDMTTAGDSSSSPAAAGLSASSQDSDDPPDQDTTTATSPSSINRRGIRRDALSPLRLPSPMTSSIKSTSTPEMFHFEGAFPGILQQDPAQVPVYSKPAVNLHPQDAAAIDSLYANVKRDGAKIGSADKAPPVDGLCVPNEVVRSDSNASSLLYASSAGSSCGDRRSIDSPPPPLEMNDSAEKTPVDETPPTDFASKISLIQRHLAPDTAKNARHPCVAPQPDLAAPNGSRMPCKRRLKALYDHSAQDASQLDFKADDILAPICEPNSGWQYGENVGTGKTGWFPAAYAEDVCGDVAAVTTTVTEEKRKPPPVALKRVGGGAGVAVSPQHLSFQHKRPILAGAVQERINRKTSAAAPRVTATSARRRFDHTHSADCDGDSGIFTHQHYESDNELVNAHPAGVHKQPIRAHTSDSISPVSNHLPHPVGVPPRASLQRQESLETQDSFETWSDDDGDGESFDLHGGGSAMPAPPPPPPR